MRKKVKICLGCLREISIHTGICPYCGFDPLKSENPKFLRVGTRLAKRYTVGKMLGEGGFGITYVAWDIVLMVPVAVKEYFPSGIATREKEGPQTGTLQIYEGKSELEFEKGKEDFCQLYGVKFSPG